MALAQINSSSLRKLLRGLVYFYEKGHEKSISKAAGEALIDYKDKIKSGKDGANVPMQSVKDSTMDMPIRYSTDKRIRKTVRSSKKPLVASGKAVGSLRKSRDSNGYKIEPSTEHGKRVFAYNSSQGASGVDRDPLIASDVQLDMLEKSLLKGIDKVLGL